jgi:uroporphyrinogen-III decarboxylase
VKREYYLQLAASGLRIPIGIDLLLHERPDPLRTVRDGTLLGEVAEAAARRYASPLAIPLMDLTLEKEDLLRILGIPEAEAETFHFREAPEEEKLQLVRDSSNTPFGARGQAHIDSLRYIAGRTDLLPVGMAIGPFSLMTKLMADPITAIAMAGMGMTPEEDANILLAERCLALAEIAIARSLEGQIKAGAKAIMICEPAANLVYLSPKQISSGADIFERFVMRPNLQIREQLASAEVDLIFHDCGELTGFMVEQFATRLDPAILSMGSSRKLWEDAELVPKSVVLFGNLPTKTFYSDAAMPVDRVEAMTLELIGKMRAAGHPHILGSECDVLHVPDAAATIRRKVEAMLTCGR